MKITKLQTAKAGQSIFMSRKNKLIVMVDEKGKFSEPMLFSNLNEVYPEAKVGDDFEMNESMEFVAKIPKGEKWKITFFRLDFEAFEKCFLSDEDLELISSGRFYVVPLPPGLRQAFKAEKVNNPLLSVFFHSKNSGGGISLILTISPGST
jgi:hypothetical protein